MTAVIADDSSVQRDVNHSIFRSCGVEVLAVCEDGKQAWEAIQKFEPDIAILDYQMPHLKGSEVAVLVRKHKLKTKVLFTTSMSQKSAAYSAPHDGILTKPISKAVVLMELGKLWHS